jgi:hypothetical protein
MKATLTALAMALLSLGMLACGGTGKVSGTTTLSSSANAGATSPRSKTASSSAAPGSYWKNDADKDSDDYAHSGTLPDDDDDSKLVALYPGKPSQASQREIAAIVKSYYAAAAADDGTKACELLDSSLAAGLSENAGSAASCVTPIDRLFAQERQQLSEDEVSTMVLTGIHMNGELALALLGFRKAPERELQLEREGRAWKIGALVDSEIP